MESVSTENKNMKEVLTRATLDNEELQDVVVLKEVNTFIFSLYYKTCIYLSFMMKHGQIT